MKLSNIELSNRLNKLREFQFSFATGLLDGFEGAQYSLILIEAARVLDWETVLMGLSSDDSLQLKYPDYDVLSRGWNPLMANILPRLPSLHGIPISESSSESRGQIRSLLYAFGKIAILKKSADMAFHGLLEGEDMDGLLSLRMPLSEESDHFLDQLEDQKVATTLKLNERADRESKSRLLSKEEIEEIVADLIFPFETGHGTMVGYGADPRLDEHFFEITVERSLEWRAEAGLHPNLVTPALDGFPVGAVMMLLISAYMKHIWFVGIAKNKLENINYAMSLTIWKDPKELVSLYSEFTGIAKSEIEKAFQAIVVTKNDAEFFANEGAPFLPMLIEVSPGYWLAPVSSIFKNPFDSMRMLNEQRDPSIGDALRAPRENWMIDDLESLFLGNRYIVITTPVRLKRGNHTITDIDAAILDITSGELALFQLKWQDFGSNVLSKIRSKAKNFVEQVGSWSEKTRSWIDEFGVRALCKSLQIKLTARQEIKTVLLFAIGKSNARFSSYGYTLKDDLISVCNWKQFVRLRYEVGPAELVLSEIHRRCTLEKNAKLDIKPLVYDMNIGDVKLRFENMWSYSE